MTVFNLCLKIFRKNLKAMMIYFGIFIFVSIMLASNNPAEKMTGFSMTKTRIGIINEENTPLVQGLKESLEEIAEFKTIEDNPNIIQDSLYYRDVHYVLRIPNDFTASFMKDTTATLSKTSMPDTTSSIYIDLKINQYLNTARLYLNQTPDIDENTLKAYVLEDLKTKTSVNMLNPNSNTNNEGEPMMQYYFNFLAYTFMFVIIIGVSTIMLVFNNPTIKKRNACSPLPASKMNLQFFLAILLFALLTWVVLISISLYFGRAELSNPNTKYFIINSLLFGLTSAAISFFIGNLVKNREAISGIANIFTLGSSFISGVFVPQEILSAGVLKIASFLPTYWYVKANSQISTISHVDWTNFSFIPKSFMIQIGFFLAFFILAMVVGKNSKTTV